MDKLGKLELNAWTIMGGLVVAYILVPQFQEMVDGFLGRVGREPVTPTIECIYDGAVMTIGPVVKKYDPATAVSAPGTRVFINGKNRGVKTDSATLDVNYKDGVALYYGHNNTDADVTKFGYYVAKQEFTVPCTSAFSTADQDVDPTAAAELVKREQPLLTIFNDDTGLKNTIGEYENITANDAANMQVKLQQKGESGFSPYGSKYLCLRYNSTLYTKVEISSMSGTPAVSSAGLPTVVSNHANRWIGVKQGYTSKCWKNAGLSGQNVQTEYYNVYLQTGSSTPRNSHHANATLSVWDEDWYKHSETELMEFGIQNDQYGDVGMTSTANVTLRLGS